MMSSIGLPELVIIAGVLFVGLVAVAGGVVIGVNMSRRKNGGPPSDGPA
jgi:hypothetical protein